MKPYLLWMSLVFTISLFANEAHHSAPVVKAPAPATKAPVAKAPAATKAAPAPAPAPGVSPDDALRKLVAGNQRFVSSTQAHPDQTIERRMDLASSQKPFAIVVSCSDSRVPPEVIFDQGLGDLFVVRTAGEVVTDVEVGSIEYAVDHLGSALILVLGHERCGAVKATVDGGHAPGSIGSICSLIQPAVDKAKAQGGDVLDNAIKNNVANVSDRIAASPIVREAIAAGRLKIMKGFYDLDEGTVRPVP